MPASSRFGITKKRLALSERSESKGFTLVELLITIAIIAILSVIGMVIFTGVQKSGRDARRKADTNAIAKAMEGNYAGQYSPLADDMFASGSVPVDPVNTPGASNDPYRCPPVCKYCYTQGSTIPMIPGSCGPGHGRAQDGYPSGGSSSYWSVCANLEGGGYYCKLNQQ